MSLTGTARERADARRDRDRRPARGDLRRARHPARAARARAQRARADRAHLAARGDGRRAVVGRGHVLRERRRAGSRRPAPSALVALRALPRRRRLPQHRGGERRDVGAARTRRSAAPTGSPIPRFADVLARVRQPRRAHARDRGRARRRDVERLGGALNAAGVPGGPVLDVAQVFADPQVLAREMLVELAAPRGRALPDHGTPREALAHAGAHRAPPAAPRRAHRRGAARVRASRATEIEALRRDGVV